MSSCAEQTPSSGLSVLTTFVILAVFPSTPLFPPHSITFILISRFISRARAAKRPLCVLGAPLQLATLEIPAESIFGDLDSGFSPAWIEVPPSRKLDACGIRRISRRNRRHKLVEVLFCMVGNRNNLLSIRNYYEHDEMQLEMIKSTEKRKKTTKLFSTYCRRQWKEGEVCSRVMLT